MKTLLLSPIVAFLLAFTALGLPANAAFADGQKPRIKAIVVNKAARTLQLIDQDNRGYKIYHVSLGFNPVGPKTQSGDGKTPEGRYVISSKNPHSNFHLSLGISYPNATDSKNARDRGVEPGGDIMIHGIGEAYAWVGGSHTMLDWTQGCIAVTNEEIEEIYSLVNEGTIVYVWP